MASGVYAQDDPLAGYPVVGEPEVLAAVRQAGPSVRAADLALEAAQAVLVQARAKQGLSVAESAGYERQQASPSTSTAATGNTFKGAVSAGGPQTSLAVTGQQTPTTTGSTTTWGLSGSQVLWDGYVGGTPSGQVRVAEAAYQVARATRAQAVRTALFDARQAYYTLLADQKTLQVRQATLKQAAENLAREQGLAAAKRATDLDVLQMQVAKRQAELDLRSTVMQIDTDRKNLSILAGWPLDKTYVAVEGTAPTPQAASADEAVSIALAQRSEIRSLAAQLESAKIQDAIQAATWSPVVTLTGGVSTSQGGSTTSTQVASVGVDVALPSVWDGGASSAARKQTTNQVAQYEIQLEQQRLSVTVEVQKAWFGIEDARDRLELAKSNVEQATGEYRMESLKFSLGLETTLDVLTAFTTMTTAQVALEQANNSVILAVLTFNNALGREEP
jgi:outer membrane protein TolC